jgi:phage/plasmid-like protein (TIGR03299 family)
MSHNILENDTVTAIEETWHGLEKRVDAINLENSGLDWLVTSQTPTFVFNGVQKPVENNQVIYRQDTGLVLHNAKSSYEIIQNCRLFEMVSNSLEGISHKIVSCGSLDNCKKVFISVAIDEKQDYMVGREQFKAYLNIFSSHDGTYPVIAHDSNVRMVCMNTVRMSLRDNAVSGKYNLRVMHTKNSSYKISNMEETLETIFEKRDEWFEIYADLKMKQVSEEKAKQILTGFNCTSSSDLSTRSKNITDAQFHLFKKGAGNSGETLGDLLNGVTQYYTHEASDDQNKLFQSNEIGSFGKRKEDFFNGLIDDAWIDSIAKKGEMLLSKKELIVA